MFSYILRRTLLMFPTLIGITVIVFGVMSLAPGGIGAALRSAEGNMRAEDRAKIEAYYKKRYGLDKPKVVQYLNWLNQVSPLGFRKDDEGNLQRFGFKWPDLGESF